MKATDTNITNTILAAKQSFGLGPGSTLLNAGNAKTIKGEKKGWRTYGMHLSPADIAGHEVCSWRSKGCTFACLNTAGRGIMALVQEARIKKTRWLFGDPVSFLACLHREIAAAIKSAERAGLQPCIRLNLTSDIPWEAKLYGNIPSQYPGVQFYDYTAGASRAIKSLKGKAWPSNYHLTFSRKEDNEAQVAKVMAAGGNVAAVFRDTLPARWRNVPVVNGDESDLRFLDRPHSIVGLKEKGLAKQDETGFVIG